MNSEVQHTPSLNSLVNEIDNIGKSDKNYVNKFEFIQKALYFPYTPKEKKLLSMHIAKTYGIFVLELLLSVIIAITEFIKLDYFISIFSFFLNLGKWSLVIYFIYMLITFWLSGIASERDNIYLKFLSILLLVGMISQVTILVIFLLISSFGVIATLKWTLLSFLITAALFISSALYGLLTKSNITGWGGPLTGILVALIIFELFTNFLFKFTGYLWFIVAVSSIIDIIVFTFFIMYDNQILKVRFLAKYRDDIPDTKRSWWILSMDSSIDLYLDFINLFLDFLTLFSSNEDDD